jgi:hypothetical protein
MADQGRQHLERVNEKTYEGRGPLRFRDDALLDGKGKAVGDFHAVHEWESGGPLHRDNPSERSEPRTLAAARKPELFSSGNISRTPSPSPMTLNAGLFILVRDPIKVWGSAELAIARTT